MKQFLLLLVCSVILLLGCDKSSNSIPGGSFGPEVFFLPSDADMWVGGDLVVDDAGDIYVLGESKSTGATLAKLTAEPELLWSSDINSGYRGNLSDLLYTTDGYLVATGSQLNPEKPGGELDVWTIKMDGAGNKIWESFHGSDSIDIGTSIAEGPNGDYVVGGRKLKPLTFYGPIDAILMGISSADGALSWTTTYREERAQQLMSVVSSESGGFTGAGTITKDIGNVLTRELFLIHVDDTGRIEWQSRFGAAPLIGAIAAPMVQVSDGGYLLAAQSDSPSDNNNNIIIERTNSTGTPSWSNEFDGARNDDINSIVLTVDDGALLLGSTSSYGNGAVDVYLIKIDREGNELWSRTYGGKKMDLGSGIAQVNDNLFAITGTTESGPNENDMFLLLVDDEGIPID